MNGTVLCVSRWVCLHQLIKKFLETLGFCNVTVTAEEKDDLDRLISELKPKLLMMEADFYQGGTPYMAGKLQERFPKLCIAAVAVSNYPLRSGAGFIWKGIKSYANLREGCEEFLKGLQLIREGKEYISPLVQNLIDHSEWPDTDKGMTKRLVHKANSVPDIVMLPTPLRRRHSNSANLSILLSA
jgi:hypothetical protein